MYDPSLAASVGKALRAQSCLAPGWQSAKWEYGGVWPAESAGGEGPIRVQLWDQGNCKTTKIAALGFVDSGLLFMWLGSLPFALLASLSNTLIWQK